MRKNIIKKAVALLTGVVFAIAGLTGCGKNDENADKQTTVQAAAAEATVAVEGSKGNEQTGLINVRLGVYTGGADHYIALVGKDQGIFEKYGLSIESYEFPSGIATVDAMTNDQVDIGMVADYALVNRIGNSFGKSPIRIISRVSNTYAYNLYVNPEKIKSDEDLKSAKIVTYRATIIDYFNALLGEKIGADLKDNLLTAADGATGLAAVVSGDADATWATGAGALKLLEAGQVKYLNIRDINTYVDSYYVTTKEYLDKNSDVVAKFFKAVKETEEWILAHKEETAAIADKTALIPTEQSLALFEEVGFLLDLPVDSIDHLESIKSYLIKKEIITEDYKISDYADASALKSAVTGVDAIDK